MNRFLDVLARMILGATAVGVVGLITFAFYQHPEIILRVVGGLAGVFVVVWAMDRVLT